MFKYVKAGSLVLVFLTVLGGAAHAQSAALGRALRTILERGTAVPAPASANADGVISRRTGPPPESMTEGITLTPTQRKSAIGITTRFTQARDSLLDKRLPTKVFIEESRTLFMRERDALSALLDAKQRAQLNENADAMLRSQEGLWEMMLKQEEAKAAEKPKE